MTKNTGNVFDLTAAAEEASYPAFFFKFGPRNKKYRLPNLFTLTPEQMARIEDASDFDDIQALFSELGAEPVGKLLAEIPVATGQMLLAQWRAHGQEVFAVSTEVDPDDEGKGSTSSTSSGPNRAARRSKRT